MYSVKHISGAQLLEPPDVAAAIERDLAKNSRGPRPLFGGFRFPPHFLNQHTAILGSTGSGKTRIIDSLVSSIVPNWVGGRSGTMRMVCHDAKSNYLQLLHNLGLTVENGSVIVTNPYDERCSKWLTGVDINSIGSALELSELLIPRGMSKGSDAYWVDAARAIVFATTQTLIQVLGEKWTLRDLFIPLYSNQDLLPVVLATTGMYDSQLRSLFGSSQHAAGVKSELLRALTSLIPVIAYTSSARSTFSLRDFMGSSKVLLLGVSYEFTRATEVLNQLLFSRLVDLTCAKTPGTDPRNLTDRTIFVLDEIAEMGELSSLRRLLTFTREMGGTAILGAQSVVQLKSIYQDDAFVILGNCGNISQLPTRCSETAQWASGVFGSRRVVMEMPSGSTTKQAGDSRFGAPSTTSGFAAISEEQPIVSVSDIYSLPPTSPLTGISGFYSCQYGGFTAGLNWKAVDDSIPKSNQKVIGLQHQRNPNPQVQPWSDAESSRFSEGMRRLPTILGGER